MSRLRRNRVVSLEALREAKRHELEPADDRRWADPATRFDGEEATDRVREALAALAPEYREVLIMKHFENLSYEQIAETTGDSIGTLKVRAYRARRMLRDRLERLGWRAVRKERNNG
jgi:RNA polymerase sigma-70 factor (ECF subfamily)